MKVVDQSDGIMMGVDSRSSKMPESIPQKEPKNPPIRSITYCTQGV